MTTHNKTKNFLTPIFFFFFPGQERFQGLGSAFFRGSDGVLFVFDVTRPETFAELERWKQTFLIQIGQEGNTEFPVVILANKVCFCFSLFVSLNSLLPPPPLLVYLFISILNILSSLGR